MNTAVRLGPGLAKCGLAHPFPKRVLNLVRCADALWSEWLEHADVVSEGRIESEGGVAMYRGTTSVIVLSIRHGGCVPDEAVDSATQVAMRDPHFWLRAMRIARREAVSRTDGSLDRIQVELHVRVDPRGIRVDIDVEGRVFVEATRVKTKG
ncbi:MAG: hypothetical protein HY898_11890 [Deltaproteobacteria bacterium]|nr:hypothetical protein [Deltaproteobacteria bacterium]